jgi:hypothetical protein
MAISSQHQHIFAIIIYVFSYVIFRSIYIYIYGNYCLATLNLDCPIVYLMSSFVSMRRIVLASCAWASGQVLSRLPVAAVFVMVITMIIA